MTLADVRAGGDGAPERIKLRADWDLALGGGAMPGSVVLVYGPGGVGKSTDLLLLCSMHNGAFAATERKLEEIDRDVRNVPSINPRRIMPSECRTMRDCIAHFETIGSTLSVLDSWNALAAPDPKTDIAALREAIGNGVVLVICHQTKEGGLRGPETLAHAVNTVVRMQKKHLRVEKNWHGPLVRVARELPTFRGTPSPAPALSPAPRRRRRVASEAPKTARRRFH